MDSIAIVIVAYNRTESVKRLLNSLSCAYYSQEAPLIISIDKSDTDAVENLADDFEWTHGVKRVVKHKENLGLRKHILSIGDYTKEYDAVIVLEDDLVVSPSFYNYALEAVTQYKNDDRIAGISLYNFSLNHQTYLPFVPEKREHDVFLLQLAQSWGQIWMSKQWKEFIEWYANHSEEFSDAPHLPHSICHYGKNSWLKYHDKYCIENNKFFVYPYFPLTFCTGEAGVHSNSILNNVHNITQYGNMRNYRFPSFDEAVKYDAFFERMSFEQFLDTSEVCYDIHGNKGNRTNNRFWLTTRIEPYKVIKSYGLMYIPIEENIAMNTSGEGIYLYDTKQSSKKPKDNTFLLLNYYFKFNGILSFMNQRGLVKSYNQLFAYTFKKIFNRIWKF